MPRWLFGFETKSSWLWSLTIFSSVLPHHLTFIDQTTPHFPSDEVFHDSLYYVSFRVKAEPVLVSHLVLFLTMGKSFSLKVSAFPSVREEAGHHVSSCIEHSMSNHACDENQSQSWYSLLGQRLM